MALCRILSCRARSLRPRCCICSPCFALLPLDPWSHAPLPHSRMPRPSLLLSPQTHIPPPSLPPPSSVFATGRDVHTCCRAQRVQSDVWDIRSEEHLRGTHVHPRPVGVHRALASSAHLGAHRSAAGFDAHARRAPFTLAARSDRRLRRSLATMALLSRSLRPSRSHRTDPLDSAAVLASQRCTCRTPLHAPPIGSVAPADRQPHT
jgi:hypothetical protein